MRIVTLNYLPHPAVFFWHPWVHLSGPRSNKVFDCKLKYQISTNKIPEDFEGFLLPAPAHHPCTFTKQHSINWIVLAGFFKSELHLFVLPSAAWCSRALSIMMLVSDSRDAAFVVNSVVRRSSLSSASLLRASLLVAKLWRAAPRCWMSPFSWSTLLRAACLLATGSLLASISNLSLLAQRVSSLPLT